MATNQLLPFANGDVPNVIPFDQWNALAARLTGFQSGIASSQQFNYILAQGGAAGYVIGQMIADFAGQDATIDGVTLYANLKSAIAAFVPANVADGSISGAKITDQTVAFQKLAPASIATQEQAEAGTATNVLMTSLGVKQSIDAFVPVKVSEENSSGSSWYRVWSDGFIMQGGFVEGASSQTGTISLQKNFTGSGYLVFVNCFRDNSSFSPFVNISNKNSTSFVWGANEYVRDFDWIAVGY